MTVFGSLAAIFKSTASENCSRSANTRQPAAGRLSQPEKLSAIAICASAPSAISSNSWLYRVALMASYRMVSIGCRSKNLAKVSQALNSTGGRFAAFASACSFTYHNHISLIFISIVLPFRSSGWMPGAGRRANAFRLRNHSEMIASRNAGGAA